MGLLDNIPILNMFSNAQDNMMQGFHNFGQQMVNNAQWKRQNRYNAPKAQMARLKEAGLNPNLVYGNGVATQPAAQMSNMQPNQYKMDVADSFMKGQQLKQSAAQTDNLQAQNNVINQELLLKLAQTVLTQTENQRKQFDLGLSGELRQTNLDYRAEQLRQLRGNITYTADQNARQELLTANTLAMGVASIARMKSQNLTDAQTRSLMQLEINLAKQGIHKGDPAWIRAGIQFAERNGWLGKIKENWLPSIGVKFK